MIFFFLWLDFQGCGVWAEEGDMSEVWKYDVYQSVETEYILKDRQKGHGQLSSALGAGEWLPGCSLTTLSNTAHSLLLLLVEDWFQEKVIMNETLNKRKIFFRKFKNIHDNIDIHQTLIEHRHMPDSGDTVIIETTLLSKNLSVNEGQSSNNEPLINAYTMWSLFHFWFNLQAATLWCS